jgi:acetyl-CoA carboxylase, biotin carboxylase subunit
MKKILIANRGEIALRIMRSIKEMGIKTVAVFSEADRLMPHTIYANESVCIGPAPSSESYLNGEKIIEIALKLNVDAIHPGYGFLSENEEFARKVTDAGIKFIGPSTETIKLMGNKLAAKATLKDFGIPMVPGTEKAVVDSKEAKDIATKIGFPVLIKAAAGGGGKGMKIVQSENEFEEQIQQAISEAKSAFGDGSVFIEKYIASPRHIEVQILADQHGNVVHLFERECSVQRRHQKVIEEAPSTVLDEETRKKMTETAVKVAKACNYEGAGTVEFLYDHGQFYFLEMNTRLQVEHTVTEFITGTDLVKEQVKVAMGDKLSFLQDDLKIKGHSIELRVYAEDPKNNFLPDIGILKNYKRPGGIGIRIDDGYDNGLEIPIYYDPIISKLIVYAPTRQKAIVRMKRAIDEYKFSGIESTLSFGKFVMEHEAFVSGDYDTHFVQKYFDPEKSLADSGNSEIAAIIMAKLINENKRVSKLPEKKEKKATWRTSRTN